MIHVNTFFSGATVRATALVPWGSDVVMELFGEARQEILMKKGRIGGLWMNVGEVRVHGAPSLYLVMSNTAKLLQGEGDGSWGYGAIKRVVRFTESSAGQDTPVLFYHFLKLKERDGLYMKMPGKLEVVSSRDDRWLIQGEFPIPTKVKPGSYKVCLKTIRDGRVVHSQCVPLEVVRVGFPAFLHNLSQRHGTLYGILSILIALSTGYFIGLIFRKGGGH